MLFIRDPETGEERPVYDKLSKDQQEAWAIFGPYVNIDWMPDNQHLVFWSEGKIYKVNIETLSNEIIPFEVQVEHKLSSTAQTEAHGHIQCSCGVHIER